MTSIQTNLSNIILRQAREGIITKEKFFNDSAEQIVTCATAMAEAFDRKGRLFAMGNGGSACDALHFSVEFMHPIIQKRPALPALALTTDNAILTAIGNDHDFSMTFAQQLKVLARSEDIAVGISTSGKSANVYRGLKAAKELQLLSIGLTGRDGGRLKEVCDHCFIVPSFSIPRIQETHSALIHILWDLVHIIRGEEDIL